MRVSAASGAASIRDPTPEPTEPCVASSRAAVPACPSTHHWLPQPTVAPVHILQAQSRHLAGSQTQSRQAQRQSIIAFAQHGATVELSEQLLELSAAQVSWQVLPVMARDGRQRHAQVLRMASGRTKKPAERAQRRSQRLQLPGLVTVALLKHVIQQRFGRELVYLQLNGFRRELRFEKQAYKGRPFRAGAWLETSHSDQVLLISVDHKVARRL